MGKTRIKREIEIAFSFQTLKRAFRTDARFFVVSILVFPYLCIKKVSTTIMNDNIKKMTSGELEQLYCFILLDEIREKVRKLKAYGVEDFEIMSAMNEEELFPQLVVTEDYKIVLAEEKPIEVEMEPLVKAVYLLFLSHSEGIIIKHLPDYRKELTDLYLLLKPYGLTERVKKSIADVTNPTQNSINEKCARIRKLFSSLLPKSVARYYSISGKRGEPKKIDLVRANVIWKCKLPDGL